MTVESLSVTSMILEEFSLNFINEVKKEKENIEKTGDKKLIAQILPKTFKGESAYVHAVYSHNRKHVLIRFNSSNQFHFNSREVTGDVMDFFDPDGFWNGKPVGIRVESSSAHLKGGSFIGVKPFEIVGDSVEIAIESFELQTPRYGAILLEYAFIFSYDIFLERLANVKEFARDFVSVYKEYVIQDKPKEKFKEDFRYIKSEMERLFFDEDVRELDIDNFFKDNPSVLNYCLGLSHPLHQVTLSNIHGRNPKDFKPDLIAYSEDEKVWKIVDYKRAKRNIIKNQGKARTHFRAEIAELQAQLRDYYHYFRDFGQQQHFKDEYGELIEYPETIGIIGRVEDEQVRDFNMLKSDMPRWIDLVPYNYLYERYCRYINVVETLIK